MKKILHTSFPCIVKCGNEEAELSINEKLIIENNEKIFVYPTNKNRCSFEVDPLSPSPFYRMIKKDGDYLFFLLDGLYSENVLCKEFGYNGAKCKVEVGKRTITFNGNSDKKIIHLLSEPSSVTLGSFLFICYALYSNDSGQTLIAYNPKHNSAKVFSAERIEIEKDGFTLYKSPYSYKDIIERYYVDNEGLKVLNKTFSPLPGSAPVETVVYKFMTAIKYGDFSGALESLNSALKNKLNEKTLKEFFGDVSYFYMLDSQTCFAISNNKNILYDFVVEDDKIADIDTLDDGN